MRRTGMGQLGDPGVEKIARAADIMAGELGWNEARARRKKSQSLAPNFALQTAMTAFVVVNPRSCWWPHQTRMARDRTGVKRYISV